MVSFKQYQQMNETMSIVKGTCDSNWGDICVLAVGDLYQLPPVGQCPIYISPHTAHTLDDFAPNGWEDMKLHELTEIMHQKDVHFAQNLNKIHLAVPQPGSKKIECYKDVNYKLMKMMIPSQKMSLMSMHKIISVMNGTTKELPLSKGTHMSV